MAGATVSVLATARGGSEMDAEYFDFLVEVGDPEATAVFAEVRAASASSSRIMTP
jgi:hypothetical protein